MTTNRGKTPSEKTKLILFARAAGRCQFKGCNKWLFTDKLTWTDLNNSNIAHIVASSPNGPRGNVRDSYRLSDDINNLMLLCKDHHKVIDDDPETYTVEILREMKEKRERAIQRTCDRSYAEETNIIRVISPIKGSFEACTSYRDTVEALDLEKAPSNDIGLILDVSPIGDYKDADYWKQAKCRVDKFRLLNINGILDNNRNAHFSVFPFAPIPIITYLGYVLGDKIRCDIYQKKRFPDTWKWLKKEQTNEFEYVKTNIRQGSKVAIVIELTDRIEEELIKEAFDADIIYKIQASRYGVDCIESKADLSAFWHMYQQVCSEIKNTISNAKVAIFPAIPVSAAFEIGRRYMPGIYPVLSIYENDNGFFKTLEIGGEINE